MRFSKVNVGYRQEARKEWIWSGKLSIPRTLPKIRSRHVGKASEYSRLLSISNVIYNFGKAEDVGWHNSNPPDFVLSEVPALISVENFG